jgi:hypothetical protein
MKLQNNSSFNGGAKTSAFSQGLVVAFAVLRRYAAVVVS